MTVAGHRRCDHRRAVFATGGRCSVGAVVPAHLGLAAVRALRLRAVPDVARGEQCRGIGSTSAAVPRIPLSSDGRALLTIRAGSSRTIPGPTTELLASAIGASGSENGPARHARLPRVSPRAAPPVLLSRASRASLLGDAEGFFAVSHSAAIPDSPQRCCSSVTDTFGGAAQNGQPWPVTRSRTSRSRMPGGQLRRALSGGTCNEYVCRRQRACFAPHPFRHQRRRGDRERIGHRWAMPGAEGASTRPRADARLHLSAPLVIGTSRAAPPHFRMRPRPDVGRQHGPVPRGVPLPDEVGKPCDPDVTATATASGHRRSPSVPPRVETAARGTALRSGRRDRRSAVAAMRSCRRLRESTTRASRCRRRDSATRLCSRVPRKPPGPSGT